LIDTYSIDAALEALGRVADVRSYEVPGGSTDFALRLNHFRSNHIDVTYSASTVEGTVDYGGRTQVRQQIALGGGAASRLGTITVDVGADVCVIPADAEVRICYGPSYQQILLRIDIDAATAKLEALIGAQARGKLEFALRSDVRDRHQQRLQRLVVTLDHELASTESEPNTLIMTEYEQLIIMAFLIANLRNYDRFVHGAIPATSPWQVRAAEEYVEANWRQPITIEDLCRATNAGARALFKTFKEARGYSPMAFVKRVRLTRAREMLSSGTPQVTVTSVALQCGFFNLGHFAAEYRRAFAELPSETLASHR
jgi:AraC-like DNA-binding protein